MDPHRLYRSWLIIISSAIILTGIIIAFLVEPSSLPVEQTSMSKWVLGLLGATMMGWAATMLLVGRYAFDQKLPELLRILLIGLVVWFVPYTFISAYFSAYFNVVINSVVLAVASTPLIAGQKVLKKKTIA